MHKNETAQNETPQGNGILCLGSVMVDLLLSVPALPLSGEGVVAEENSIAIGGCAFNSASAIRQSGGSCTLLAPVGRGVLADYIRSGLRRCGLEPFDVDVPMDCGAALCLVEPDGERTMVTIPGIERRFSREWCADFDFSEYAVVLVCGYEIDGAGGTELIAVLEEHPHLRVCFAPGPPTAVMVREKIDRINALRPLWHLNEMEACAFTGCADAVEAGFAISQLNRNVVIITAGPKGAYVFDSGTCSHIPTSPIEPVDSTGAGDAHIGAVLAKRQQGANWQEAVAFANRVSAAVCGVRGATLTDEQFNVYVNQAK